MSLHLHHKMAVLHKSLLHGKLPRSLHWADAVELMGHLGQVESQGDDFTFVVAGQRESFKRPRVPEFGIAEVSRLRRFLKQAGSEPAPIHHAPLCRMVVIIDHHAAHVFCDPGDGRSKGEFSVHPDDPHHFRHHLIHRKEAHYQGDRVPEEVSFYAEVAEALVPANEIVMVGHGTGKSSAVDALVEYLGKHHMNIAQRVKATEVADISALTGPQIEAMVKRHMTAAD